MSFDLSASDRHYSDVVVYFIDVERSFVTFILMSF